jgi:hypothetical protein
MAILTVWYPKAKSGSDMISDGVDTSNPETAVYSLISNVGHASLTLDRTFPHGYISWWPGKNTPFATPSYEDDVKLEDCPPTVSVRLDCLNEKYIFNWWSYIKNGNIPSPYHPAYHPVDFTWNLDRNNCSHMVWLALKVGGAERYASLYKAGEMVSPPQIHAYALRINAMKLLGY